MGGSTSQGSVLTDLRTAEGVLRAAVEAGKVAGASVTSAAMVRGPRAGSTAVAVWIDPPDLVSVAADRLRSSVAARRGWKASQVAPGDVAGSCRVALVAARTLQGVRGLAITADVVVTLFGAEHPADGSAS